MKNLSGPEAASPIALRQGNSFMDSVIAEYSLQPAQPGNFTRAHWELAAFQTVLLTVALEQGTQPKAFPVCREKLWPHLTRKFSVHPVYTLT